jgi:hypothetical protein
MINENSTKAEVLEAVTKDGWELKYASDALRGDRDVVMAAVKKWGGALRFASDDLQNDRDVVMAAVNEDWLALKFASEELQGDREVIMADIKQNLKTLLSIHGAALESMEQEAKNDETY